jgi:hypothetical protein
MSKGSVVCPSSGTKDIIQTPNGEFVECCRCDTAFSYGHCPTCGSNDLAGVGSVGLITCKECASKFDENEWSDFDDWND